MILIAGIFGILSLVITIYMWIVAIAALLSWVRPDPNNTLVIMIYRLSEPGIKMLRKIMPTTFNGIDLAPFIVVLICIFLDSYFLPFLYNLIANP